MGGWVEARFLRVKRARKRGARAVDSEERVWERGGIGSSSLDGGTVGRFGGDDILDIGREVVRGGFGGIAVGAMLGGELCGLINERGRICGGGDGVGGWVLAR